VPVLVDADAPKDGDRLVAALRQHGMSVLARDPVRGFVYDVNTGWLSEVFPDRETVTG
jgi:hypothetical protein